MLFPLDELAWIGVLWAISAGIYLSIPVEEDE
jgi:hypothetical protein